jgi:hypothetical protein
MRTKTEPTIGEWHDLQTIVSNVEVIVSDPPPAYEYSSAPGLLESYSDAKERDRAAQEHRTAVRRSDQLLKSVSGASGRQIVDILPGLDNIGHSRSERLNNLLAKMSGMTAYSWLRGNSAYGDLLKSLTIIAKTRPSYQRDTREFLLLHSIIFPMSLFLIQRQRNLTPAYPTKIELQSASRQVRAIVRFFEEKSAIYGVVDTPYLLRDDLRKLGSQIELALTTYRKPRDDGTLRERSLLDYLIPSLFSNFNECSPTLVEHVLAIVDVSYDRSD